MPLGCLGLAGRASTPTRVEPTPHQSAVAVSRLSFTDSSALRNRLNARLDPRDEPFTDLGSDFSDGTRLIRLVVRRLG